MLGSLVSLVVMIVSTVFFSGSVPSVVWAATSGLTVGIGVAVWTFYFRHHNRGTTLWLPRPFADFLSERARKTRNSVESFGIGMLSVVGELLFTSAPLLVASLLIMNLTPPLQLAAVAAYTVIALSPTFLIIALVGGGYSLGAIQKWRESNKRFLQFSAGAALIILGIYLYIDTIVAGLYTQGAVL